MSSKLFFCNLIVLFILYELRHIIIIIIITIIINAYCLLH